MFVELNVQKKMVIKKVIRPREVIIKQGLDPSIIRKRGNSKTFQGYLIQKIKETRNEKNFDMAMLLQELYKKYLSYEVSEKIMIKSWRGKGDIKEIGRAHV